MVTRSELQQLARIRLEDAVFLQQAGRSSSAYYLAGYSVELALKACIAKSFQPDAIPDRAFVNAIYTHKLDSLVGTAGLRVQFDADTKADPQFAAYWIIASQWNEESRYKIWDLATSVELLEAISEPSHRVFQWVIRYW